MLKRVDMKIKLLLSTLETAAAKSEGLVLCAGEWQMAKQGESLQALAHKSTFQHKFHSILFNSFNQGLY